MYQYVENNSLSSGQHHHEEDLSNNIDYSKYERSNQREDVNMNNVESIFMNDSYDDESRIFEDIFNLVPDSGIYDHNENQGIEFEDDSNLFINDQCIH